MMKAAGLLNSERAEQQEKSKRCFDCWDVAVNAMCEGDKAAVQLVAVVVVQGVAETGAGAGAGDCCTMYLSSAESDSALDRADLAACDAQRTLHAPEERSDIERWDDVLRSDLQEPE